MQTLFSRKQIQNCAAPGETRQRYMWFRDSKGNLSDMILSTCFAPNLSCQFNGQTIQSGQSVQAFLSSSVSFGQTCQSETRTCTNGVLSGTFAFASCQVGQPQSCLFNGQTIAHGQSAMAFQNSSVPFGQSCQSESRLCQNGVLSGSFAFSSCAPGQPISCLFNGQTIAHGQSVAAFQAGSVPFGQTCAQENRLCLNGVLSGSFQFGSCSAGQPQSCLFNGQTIAHGQSVQAFQSTSVPFGQSCQSESRMCINGTLSGSFAFGSCQVQPAAPPPVCLAGSAQSAFVLTPYQNGQSGVFHLNWLGSPCGTPIPLNCDQGTWRHPNGAVFVSPYGPPHIPYESCGDFSIPGFGSAG